MTSFPLPVSYTHLTYLPNFIHIRKNETCQFTGPGFLLPGSLSVGQHLEDGYMTIQQSSLQTRISQKNRVVTAQTRIKVPAGDFICYKIESNLQTTCLGITTRYKISTWYAQGIGIILSLIHISFKTNGLDIIIPLSGKVNSSFCRKPLPDHFQPIPDYSRPTIRDIRLRMKLDTMDR